MRRWRKNLNKGDGNGLRRSDVCYTSSSKKKKKKYFAIHDVEPQYFFFFFLTSNLKHQTKQNKKCRRAQL